MILLENPSGKIVKLDLFHKSLPAKHSLIIGSTGGGKSFTANFLIESFLTDAPNNHVVILDVGGSYRKLCRLFGGKYLEINLSDEYAFNPFPTKDLLFTGENGQKTDEADADLLSYLTLLVSRMALDKGETLTNLGQSIIEKSVLKAYSLFPDEQAPILSDVRERLQDCGAEDEETKKLSSHFARSLELWTTGRYGRLVNKRKSLDTEARLIVFDLQKLSAHEGLQSVMFFVIKGLIEKKLRDLSLRKMVVIDEGWQFFSDPVGSLLIQNFYRTMRKFDGAVCSISQSPKDFLDTPAATAIISNSYIKYITKLTKGTDLLGNFELNQKEINEVVALKAIPGKFADIFVKFLGHGTTIRIEPASIDYWICTTDPGDRKKEDAVRLEYPGASEMEILRELARRYPIGGGSEKKEGEREMKMEESVK